MLSRVLKAIVGIRPCDTIPVPAPAVPSLRANDTNDPVLESLTTLRFAAVEDLHVNPFRRDAKVRERRPHIRHKGSRAMLEFRMTLNSTASCRSSPAFTSTVGPRR